MPRKKGKPKSDRAMSMVHPNAAAIDVGATLLMAAVRADRTPEPVRSFGTFTTVLFYNTVRHGVEYVDPGASFYETRYRKRVVDNLHRRAKAFGFVLQPLEPGPPIPGGAVS